MVVENVCAKLRAIYYRISRKAGGSISISSSIGKNVQFEGMNSVGTQTRLTNVEMGYGTYVANESDLSDCRIGRYCCIGSNVRRIAGTHPTRNFVSMHPAFFSKDHVCGLRYVEHQKFEELPLCKDGKHSILIGNDVWIGSEVSILDGVTIGDGAVIAAGAVVTKDVEPYTIMGGVPARLIRKRFSDSQIEKLLKLQWWLKDSNWIEQHAEYFENVDVLLEKAGC